MEPSGPPLRLASEMTDLCASRPSATLGCPDRHGLSERLPRRYRHDRTDTANARPEGAQGLAVDQVTEAVAALDTDENTLSNQHVSGVCRFHGQGVSVPGPACNATRHGSTSLNTGGFPGYRVATRVRAAAASPFASTEPPSDAKWLVVPSAGRLPARHRDERDSGTGLRLAAPTSASADNAAPGSLWMAAPYHRVTKSSRASRQVFP